MIIKMINLPISISSMIISTQIQSKTGLLHNWTWYPAAGQKIEFRNLFNQIGMNRITERNGREWYNDGRYIKINRTQISEQINLFRTAGRRTFIQ